ncbi:MAG: hypothetical protein WBB98_03980 [Xanthobacteraceae bacterium]
MPSFQIVLRTAWRDTLSSLNRLRYLAFVVFLIYVADLVVWTFILPDGGLGKALNTLLSVLAPLAVVPYQIAIFRLIILRDVTATYSFTASTNRVRRFLAWSVALWTATTLPDLALELFPLPNNLATALIVSFLVAGIFFILRLVLLFPAIAVDALGASASNAFADSSGHLWFIARSMLIACLPVVVAVVALIVWIWLAYVSDIRTPNASQQFIGITLLGALGAITATTSAVTVARLYEWIGERVKGVPIEDWSSH